MTAIQRGDYRAALQHLQAAAQLNPGHLDTRYNLPPSGAAGGRIRLV